MSLLIGDLAPAFTVATTSRARFVFDTAAGRYLLVCILPRHDAGFADLLDRTIANHRLLLDDTNIAFFGVVRDPAQLGARTDSIPGVRWMLDPDLVASNAFDMPEEGRSGAGWLLIDPSFRIMATCDLEQTQALFDLLPTLPPLALHAGVETSAPVLVAPRILEPNICQALIQAYEAAGGEASGFMREVDGRTVEVRDASHKIRRDHNLPLGPLRDTVRARIERRLLPLIHKVFQFTATRMERDLVACYDAAESGFFSAHRDNTTAGTVHRRFAVTINLNAEDYEGGDLRFPEFGPKLYRAPTGGAVVFSCSLLHEASVVTRGRRYAFLPFLYDEAGAALREKNAGLVGEVGYEYRA